MQLEISVRLVCKVRQVQRVIRVMLDHKAHKGLLVRRVQLVLLDRQAQRVLKDHRAISDHKALQVHRD